LSLGGPPHSVTSDRLGTIARDHPHLHRDDNRDADERGTDMEVKAGKPEVTGIDSRTPELVRISVPVKPTPNQDWKRIFDSPPSGYGHAINMQHPKIHGSQIDVSAPPDEADRYMHAIHERVQAANEQYVREIQPQIEAREEQKRVEEQRREQMLATARERIAPWTS
jgi:hypothetical protein